ncbi:MAG TPA: TM0106 family RecB-like putative nuclease, partial [Candidatus Limnocylindrales bacterium]|nr:TM0106 family RecB-like putative nuclease [Candidatus Limnocylindrales bacterium]
DRLNADPTMHIYHYAAYEKTALARLAQRHATREEEVDRLLTGRVLVDLFRVVRQGIRASVESYSIKRLEPLYGLEREVELRSAGSSIVAFEAWLEGGEDESGAVGEAILQTIAGYNRDDVVSNWRLRDWLELRREDLARERGAPIPRPPIHPEAEEPAELTESQRRTAELVAKLIADVPAEPTDRTPEQAATWLLAQLLDWHRREDRAFWWRFFELAGMTDEELVDQREPLGKIELVEDLGTVNHLGTRHQTFRFPLQDHGMKKGREVVNPETVPTSVSEPCGEVIELDEVNLTITLKRTRRQLAKGIPKALIPHEHFQTGVINAALMRIAEWVLEHGVDADGPYRAARDLLLRRPPHRGAAAAALRGAGETPLEAAVRLAPALDGAALAIQGPPGSGKTYTAAKMIVELVRQGRRVGVTANSHKVIGHALDMIHEQALAAGVPVRIAQKPSQDEDPTCGFARPIGSKEVRGVLEAGEVDVVGGTAWLWSRDDVAGSLDVLFVDEAAQFALANAVAVSPAARSLVLLGDPRQLEQPLQGSHPPGAEKSALGHVLGDDAVIDERLGLFLADTWRLHPDICTFTSEVFYEDRLAPEPSLRRQVVAGRRPADGTGLRWLPVMHPGDATESVEEADRIASLVDDLLRHEARWTDRDGRVHPVELQDIVIVAPYNAHVERIAKVLAHAGYPNARVGTVDKFQGQEAPISVYSMATSTPEEAPRGMEFLYSLNRLNVATSRARCVAIVVASPELVRVACHTPRQMQLANALCRFVELAAGSGAGAGGAGPPAALELPPQPPPDGTPRQLSWLAEGPLAEGR